MLLMSTYIYMYVGYALVFPTKRDSRSLSRPGEPEGGWYEGTDALYALQKTSLTRSRRCALGLWEEDVDELLGMKVPVCVYVCACMHACVCACVRACV